MTSPIDDYVDRLRRALAAHGITGERTLEEAREHLVDAVDAGLRSGLDAGAAFEQALVRFGPPDALAERYATDGPAALERAVTSWRTGTALGLAASTAGVAFVAISLFTDVTRATWLALNDLMALFALACCAAAGFLAVRTTRRARTGALAGALCGGIAAGGLSLTPDGLAPHGARPQLDAMSLWGGRRHSHPV